MKPNNHEERVCPRCSGKMKEEDDGTFTCTTCGYEATQEALSRG